MSTAHNKKKPVNLKSGTTFISKLGGGGEFKDDSETVGDDEDSLQTLQRLENLEEAANNDTNSSLADASDDFN